MPSKDAATPMVRGLHHASVTVDALDEALEFYCGLLGCERIERPELGFTGAWLRAGDKEFHLLAVERASDMGTPPLAPTPFANHVAFTVDALEPCIERLVTEGYEVRYGASLPQVFVQDPAGNVIELTTAS